DRYSTEVVLQGFNAQLTMLDKAAGGGMGAGGDFADDGGAAEYGSYGGSSGSGSSGSFGGGSNRPNTPAPARQPALAGGGPRDDMNDEVPFWARPAARTPSSGLPCSASNTSSPITTPPAGRR